MKRSLVTLLLTILTLAAAAEPVGNIHSAKLYRAGDQTSFPVLTLGGNESLELHFDDLDADWTPSILQNFEFVRGFQNVRITNYRTSSIALVRYTHYQAQVPDRNSYPSRSGNYLLKVFINGDTSQLAFTKRFVVVDGKAAVGAQLQQPFNAQYFRTHQKLQVIVTTDNKINVMSPQDLKVVIIQNNNWNTSVMTDRPTIYRGNYYEYSDEAFTALPGGKEWRWVDIRSLRLASDRVQRMDTRKDTTEVYVKGDASRDGQIYVYQRDLNGSYNIEALENINPFWQSDYGKVHFTYAPPGGRAFEGRDVHVFGELTDYATGDRGRMDFNTETGLYEKTLLLKQGYYNYSYVTLPAGKHGYPDYSSTEGNYWATENNYTVLIYYRPFGARADELVGYASVNSVFQR
jgi:hypothetical protein